MEMNRLLHQVLFLQQHLRSRMMKQLPHHLLLQQLHGAWNWEARTPRILTRQALTIKMLDYMCAFNNFIMKQVILVSQWYVWQGDGTPSLVALRARSGDTPIPCEEFSSPLTRGKRIARNRGQGENPGADSSGTLPPLPKRLCLSLVGAPVRTLLTHKYIILDHPWCNLLWNYILN